MCSIRSLSGCPESPAIGAHPINIATCCWAKSGTSVGCWSSFQPSSTFTPPTTTTFPQHCVSSSNCGGDQQQHRQQRKRSVRRRRGHSHRAGRVVGEPVSTRTTPCAGPERHIGVAGEERSCCLAEWDQPTTSSNYAVVMNKVDPMDAEVICNADVRQQHLASIQNQKRYRMSITRNLRLLRPRRSSMPDIPCSTTSDQMDNNISLYQTNFSKESMDLPSCSHHQMAMNPSDSTSTSPIPHPNNRYTTSKQLLTYQTNNNRMSNSFRPSSSIANRKLAQVVEHEPCRSFFPSPTSSNNLAISSSSSTNNSTVPRVKTSPFLSSIRLLFLQLLCSLQLHPNLLLIHVMQKPVSLTI